MTEVRQKNGKKRKTEKDLAEPKVALVCDWLTNVGGAEKVLLELHRLYPEAPIYTSQYDPEGIDWFADADVRTGRLQKYPAKLRRLLGPLRQRWFSHLDLSEYDLVISVTGAEAKAVRVPNGIHICYCHVPTQYYWQMYKDYIKNPGFGVLNPLVRLVFRVAVRPLRRADKRAARRPDYFVTISEYAKGLIRKYYGRDAIVIHPPVEVDEFGGWNGAFRGRGSSLPSTKGRPLGVASRRKASFSSVRLLQRSSRGSDPSHLGRNLRKPLKALLPTAYYITTSRQVNWKRIDIAVKACLMTQRKMLVIGEGPEHKKLVKLAKGTKLVEFLPVMKKEKLAEYLAGAKGYLFPSLEPFGIAPVEALASGCPVIALGAGGALDYVVEGKNGLLFPEQTAKSLAEAILKFEKNKFSREKVAKSVAKFSTERFDKEIRAYVRKKLK